MLDQLDEIESAAVTALAQARDAAALEAWRIQYLGTHGRIRALMAALREVPSAQRPALGQRLNALRDRLQAQYQAQREALEAAARHVPAVDLTQPGLIETRALGRRHVLSRVREELVEVFARMGFVVAQGPELEDDEHNFVKLNIPPDHPARDPQDNFYIDDPATTPRPRMLRSQTSTVQIRVMEQAIARGGGRLRESVRIVAPGRVYRPDTVDATHSFMFHQLEGLAIDRGLTMADLKTTLLQFAQAYFGPEARVRLRPSFFPFTEPSAEMDMYVRFRPDDEPRWIELGGCGMVHPAVLSACGIDPERWSGFAFGFGIERIAMARWGIPDIRWLFENDLRFLEQV